MEEQDAIKLWKEAEISHAEFNFSCGGDSMYDTELTFYKEGKEVKANELSDYFEDAIYDNVEFYEVEDGYYLGESGTVTIELNSEEDGFEYRKSSTSEYNKSEDDTIYFELTTKQAQFLEEYVRNMSGGDWDTVINYKKDFVLTEELEEMISKLQSEFMSFIEEWTLGLDYEVRDESLYYEMNKVVKKEDGKFYAELNVSCGLYFFEDE